MHYFCTLFDQRYFNRGLALYESLARQSSPFCLWILGMDENTIHNMLKLDLPNIRLVTIKDLEGFDDRVTIARNNRSLVEFYFTSKPFLCKYIFSTHNEVDRITYLDADTYFFGTPDAIGHEMAGYSIGLTPHRFPENLKANEKFGLNNAGFISFRRDDQGLSCLSWWMDKCFEWCHDYIDNARYADQRYLDHIPRIFRNVRVIDHPGINLAPWNVSNFETKITERGITIADKDLIFYHFHGMKRINSLLWDSGLSIYKTTMKKDAKFKIYLPYLKHISLLNSSLKLLPQQDSIRGGREIRKTVLAATVRIIKTFITLVKSFYYQSQIWESSITKAKQVS